MASGVINSSKHSLGTGVSVPTTGYTCPKDGYVYLITTDISSSSYAQVTINDTINVRASSTGAQIGVDSVFVRAGMQLKSGVSGGGRVTFYPLE